MISKTSIITGILVFTLVTTCTRDETALNAKIERLTAQLGTSQWEAAVDSLADIGEPAVPALINRVQSKELSTDWIGARACYALAKMKSPEGIEVVCQTAQEHTATRRRRRYAIEALGLFNIADKTDILIQQLEEDDAFFADAAARALAMIGTPEAIASLVEIIKDRPHYVCEPDIREALVVDHTDLVVRFSIESLNTKHYWTWMKAFQGLVDIGEKAVPVLVQHIDHGDALTRLRIIRALGRIGSAQACEALLPALEDQDWMIRNEAAVALFKIKSNLVLNILRAMQREQKLAHARKDISWVIAQLSMDEVR